jgi:hypothetical protein
MDSWEQPGYEASLAIILTRNFSHKATSDSGFPPGRPFVVVYEADRDHGVEWPILD